MPPTVEPEPSISKEVYAIARDANRKYPDPVKARNFIRSKLTVMMRQDEATREAVLDLALDKLVALACYDGRADDRSKVYRATTPNASSQTDDVLDYLADYRLRGYLNGWACPNGKLLKDCTGAELLEFVDQSRSQAKGLLWNAGFYGALADKVPATDTVGATLNEKAVVAIAKSIK